MTDRQAFGIVVKALGLYFLVEAFSRVTLALWSVLQMIDRNHTQSIYMELSTYSYIIIQAVPYVVAGLFFIKRAERVVQWCSKGDSSNK